MSPSCSPWISLHTCMRKSVTVPERPDLVLIVKADVVILIGLICGHGNLSPGDRVRDEFKSLPVYLARHLWSLCTIRVFQYCFLPGFPQSLESGSSLLPWVSILGIPHLQWPHVDREDGRERWSYAVTSSSSCITIGQYYWETPQPIIVHWQCNVIERLANKTTFPTLSLQLKHTHKLFPLGHWIPPMDTHGYTNLVLFNL